MKIKYRFAVLLTALLLIPLFNLRAEESPAFAIDQRRVLQGMNRSWLQGYEPKISGNVLSLVLPLLSDQSDGTIQAELLMPDESISPFKPQTMSVKTQRSESGLYAVRLNLELYPDRENGDYACTIRVTGKTRQGIAMQTDFPYTLRIRDGAPNTEVKRVEISDMESDFTVGEDGMLRFTLLNPCRTVAFVQPVLHITDPSGDVIPREVDMTYLPDLAPGESVQVTFPVTVLAKASVARHSLKFDLTWTALGQTFTQTESYTLPVKQEIRLEQGGLKMASSVIAGDSVTLSLPLMNMGKADIINVLATVALPGVTDRQSVLVGTIAPGETRQAQITLTPGKDLSGDYEGTLTVEGTDNDGNPASFSLPISLTVEKPIKTTAIDTPTQEAEKPPILTYGLAGGCGLLFLILIVQSILLRKKIHRLEEDKL
ncbi:MAG: hypothetical protein IKH57_09300 [Clostridia bacterium]|nr:hypothetical protein [Clostridia bacterium]